MFYVETYLHKFQALILRERPSMGKANGYSLQKNRLFPSPLQTSSFKKYRGEKGYRWKGS